MKDEAVEMKLLPCPFCLDGQEDFAGLTPEAFARCKADFQVNCRCGAMGPQRATMEMAIEAWNARSPLPIGEERVSAETRKWIDDNIAAAKRAMPESATRGHGVANFAAHAAYKALAEILAALSASEPVGERERIIEECARVADQWIPAVGAYIPDYSPATAHRVCLEVAERIRALKSNPPSGEGPQPMSEQSEMVEQAARALSDRAGDYYGTWETLHDDLRQSFFQDARAVIEAMREPTEAMLGAHEALCVFQSKDERDDYRHNLREAWATMIDAALQEKAP